MHAGGNGPAGERGRAALSVKVARCQGDDCLWGMERTPVHQPSVKDLLARDTWSKLEVRLWEVCATGEVAFVFPNLGLPENCDDDD